MTRYYRDIHDDTLRMLHASRKSDGEIAKAMGLTVACVQYHRTRLRLPATVVRSPIIPALITKPPNEVAVHPPKDRPSPVAVAVAELGNRVTERNSGYLLDGRLPVSIHKLIEEANRVRVGQGRKSIELRKP